jgi:NADH-quinone oxidoreductase subunit F
MVAFIDANNWPHYVVVNADESEPGTFKDREIMEGNPFQFLEGVIHSAYAVQANAAYIYLRGEFWQLAAELDRQIAELEAAGLLGQDKLSAAITAEHLHPPGRWRLYLRRGNRPARIPGRQAGPAPPAPALPALFGLFGKPTVVNNVETLANLPMILEKGVDWFRSFGTEKSPGTKVFSLSGCVNAPATTSCPSAPPSAS